MSHKRLWAYVSWQGLEYTDRAAVRGGGEVAGQAAHPRARLAGGEVASVDVGQQSIRSDCRTPPRRSTSRCTPYLTQGLGLTQADINVLRAKMVDYLTLPGQSGFVGNAAAGRGGRALQICTGQPTVPVTRGAEPRWRPYR
jgi:hypothetical protein